MIQTVTTDEKEELVPLAAGPAERALTWFGLHSIKAHICALPPKRALRGFYLNRKVNGN